MSSRLDSNTHLDENTGGDEGITNEAAMARRGREPACERRIPCMRTRLAAAASFAVLAVVTIAQQFPLRQNVEVLTEAPMRPVNVWGMVIDRFGGEKIISTRILMDTFGMMMQLGVMSPGSQ